MATRIRDRDRGAKALIKRLSAASKPITVTVGIHEAEGSADHDGATVADVGSFHEFGLGVPQRSFIRDWSDENEAENKDRLRKIGQAVVAGKLASVEQGLERFGLFAVGSIQQRMAAGIEPPKADGTPATLIDQGILRSSITSKVNK